MKGRTFVYKLYIGQGIIYSSTHSLYVQRRNSWRDLLFQVFISLYCAVQSTGPAYVLPLITLACVPVQV
ncbi:hypothetical protein BDV39DRAFT_187897 [Aspergillus sergii]|uniref:Uncharacterized protein n=1 Tax=Aspergillus sergii TaxID=1034303 RepID=A0A5N6WI20_9EURO|nr:hypothetical protein BDV39DRAFT_187897 [Aspergillus sergii]